MSLREGLQANVQTTSVESRLKHMLKQRPCTLLAIGPMSKNCVDAVIELAYEHPVPLMLIASRRQVDAAELGGGYVNQLSTESFVKYVRSHDPEQRVIIARDHGGPWQNTTEVAQNLPLDAAMTSAKRSLAIDIIAGFDIIHLDPSIDVHQPTVAPERAVERLFDLYTHCVRVSREHDREILFEVGTEEQSGQLQTEEELRHFLYTINQFCVSQKYVMPFFVVVQTGTKVKETRNVGTLGSEAIGSAPDVSLRKLVEVCHEFGVHVKEHNTDYLSDTTLARHPTIGIHAANVAPEFGVVETRVLLELFDECALSSEKEAFLRLAYDSRKWKKWLTDHSIATDYEKAIVAGHYVFAHPEFQPLRNVLAAGCATQGFELDRVLREALKQAIRRYMRAFNILL